MTSQTRSTNSKNAIANPSPSPSFRVPHIKPFVPSLPVPHSPFVPPSRANPQSARPPTTAGGNAARRLSQKISDPRRGAKSRTAAARGRARRQNDESMLRGSPRSGRLPLMKSVPSLPTHTSNYVRPGLDDATNAPIARLGDFAAAAQVFFMSAQDGELAPPGRLPSACQRFEPPNQSIGMRYMRREKGDSARVLKFSSRNVGPTYLSQLTEYFRLGYALLAPVPTANPPPRIARRVSAPRASAQQHRSASFVRAEFSAARSGQRTSAAE